MKNKRFASILALPLAAAVLFAQSPKAQALLMAMAANGKQTSTYRWKQKTTIVRKGEPVGVILEEVRFDASGRLQRITLSKPEEKRMGPLKSKKVNSTKEDIQEVMRLAGSYANPQQLGQAIQKGEIWEGPGALRVQARSLILPIDEMTMQVNGASYLPTRIDFKTRHEGDPVSIALDYRQLDGGPSMMVRMTVAMPDSGVVVNVESYDFVRVAVPNL